MEKTDDLSANMGRPLLNVTPSAPPSYDEAIGGNYTTTNSLYPSVPIYSSQAGAPYNPPVVQTAHIQSAPCSYPMQSNVPTTHVAQPRPIVGMLPVGPNSLKTTCPSCHKTISTRINKKNCLIKYVCCLLLLGSVICSLCACLPFCMCPATRVEHFCPACNAYLGTYVHS